MVSHAALPIADRRGDELRVYFSSRDSQGRSQIGYFTADLQARNPVIAVSEVPVVGLGPRGAFDESGVTSSWIAKWNGRKYHYYTGWSLGSEVPFHLHVGLAVEDEGGVCRKVSNAPILDRSDADPHLTASPCVLIENDIWRMWYVSGLGWKAAIPKPEPIYHIKYAESRDGVRWSRTGLVCIDFAAPDEHAISRPCVVKDGECYKMWFAARGAAYRLGYAESDDGLTWDRCDDQAGLDVSSDGWDSEMIAYPFVFDDNGSRYMMYNGNGYGRTGIGLAVLDRGIARLRTPR
jgi:hypothetical protein